MFFQKWIGCKLCCWAGAAVSSIHAWLTLGPSWQTPLQPGLLPRISCIAPSCSKLLAPLAKKIFLRKALEPKPTLTFTWALVLGIWQTCAFAPGKPTFCRMSLPRKTKTSRSKRTTQTVCKSAKASRKAPRTLDSKWV